MTSDTVANTFKTDCDSRSSRSLTHQEVKLLKACLLPILVLIAYLPALISQHLFIDDYSIFYRGDSPKLAPWTLMSQEMAIFFTRLGRPGAVIHLTLCGLLLKFPWGNYACHAIGALGAMLFACCSQRWMLQKGMRYLDATILTLLLILLPSFQMAVLWITLGSALYAAAFAVLALLLVDASSSAGSSKLRTWYLIGACLLLVTAQATYQPTAMCYWSLGLIGVLYTPEPSAKESFKNGLRYFFVGVASIVTYYVLVKVGLKLYGLSAIDRATFVSVAGLPEKLRWFSRIVLFNNACSLWWAWPRSPWNWIVLANVAGALILKSVQAVCSKPAASDSVNASPPANLAWNLLGTLPWLVIFFLSSHVYGLLVKENWASLRSTTAICCSVLVVACYPTFVLHTFARNQKIVWLVRAGQVCAIGLTVYVFIASHWLMTNCGTEPLRAEMGLIRFQLRNQISSEKRHIHVIRPDWTMAVRPPVLNDEFGYPSAAADWATVPMIKKTLQEMGLDPREFQVTSGAPDAASPAEDGLILIDLRKLKYLREKGGVSP
ncbi:MAG: hypothetical protein ACO1RA_01865 [Planctomycetaceae bacterium]